MGHTHSCLGPERLADTFRAKVADEKMRTGGDTKLVVEGIRMFESVTVDVVEDKVIVRDFD